MHNGVIAGFAAIRRALVASLSDAAYDAVQSFHSDSSVAFALFLHHLPPAPTPDAPHPPAVLLDAVRATLASIAAAQREAGVRDTSLLNFCVADGDTLVATRYITSSDAEEDAASLYYAEGSAFRRRERGASAPPAASPRVAPRGPAADGEAEYELCYRDPGSTTVLVASEPITAAKGDWVAVPRNHALVVTREKGAFVNVMLAPLGAEGGDGGEVGRCLDAVRGAADVRAGRRGGGRRAPSRAPSASDIEGASAGGGGGDAADRGATPAPRPPDHRFTGHTGPVLCLATSGRHAFSGSVDRTVRAWDTDTGECVRVLGGHRHPVQRLAVAGRLLASAGGGHILTHDTVSWAPVHGIQLPEGTGSVYALNIGGDGTLFCGGQDAALRAYPPPLHWQANSGGGGGGAACDGAAAPAPATPAAVASGHCSAICSIAVVGHRVASAGGDAAIRVWEAAGLAPLGALRGHRGSVMALAAHGPSLVLSGGRDNLVRAWDLDAMVCRAALAGHGDDVLALASLRAPAAAAAARGAASPPRGAAPPGDAAPAPARHDGGLFASASADGTVRVWDGGRWACVRVLGAGAPAPPLFEAPSFVSIEATAEYVLAGGSDGQLRAWEVGCLLGASGGAPAARPPSADAAARAAKRARADPPASPTAAAATTDPATALTSPAGSRRDPGARLERELERALAAFVRLRTVSADPTLREDCFRGAKWLAGVLESIGAEIKVARPVDDRNPVVLARLGRDPSKPTVTFYGHYDVQPAMEREWATDPFCVASVDG
jgi:predicted glutamine amidotransferase